MPHLAAAEADKYTWKQAGSAATNSTTCTNSNAAADGGLLKALPQARPGRRLRAASSAFYARATVKGRAPERKVALLFFS